LIPVVTRSRRLPWIAFTLACLINLYAVYWPTEPAPTGGIPYADKVAHFGIFALVAFTGRWAGIRVRWLAPLLLVQAVGSEIVQGTLESNGRDGNAFDAIADIIGAAAGLCAWEAVLRRGGHRERPVTSDG
jgi:hypothetical protein